MKKIISVVLVGVLCLIGAELPLKTAYAQHFEDIVEEIDFNEFTDGEIFERPNWDTKKYNGDSITVETDPLTGSKALKLTKGKTMETMYAEYSMPQAIKNGKVAVSFDVRIASATKYFLSMGSVRNSLWSDLYSLRLKQDGLFYGDSKFLLHYKNKVADGYAHVEYVIDTDLQVVKINIYKDEEKIFEESINYEKSVNDLKYLNFGISTDNQFGVNAWDCVYADGKQTAENNPDGIMYVDNIKITREKPELVSAVPFDGETGVSLEQNIELIFDMPMAGKSEHIEILQSGKLVDKSLYNVLAQDEKVIVEFYNKMKSSEEYTVRILPEMQGQNGAKLGTLKEISFFTKNIIAGCDFSEGMPEEIKYSQGGNVTTEIDEKSNSMSLKIKKDSNSGTLNLYYTFPSQKTGKIQAEFDFRFENNSRYFSDIGNMLSSKNKRPARICQKTDSLWKDVNTWLFIMQNPHEYFHIKQIFNFETREYSYEISQNGKILAEFYDVNTDASFDDISSLLFSCLYQPGLNGPDDGDGIFWIDNICISDCGAEICGFSCDGTISPYEDSIFIDYDIPLNSENIEEHIKIYRGDAIMSNDKYSVLYNVETGKEGNYETHRGRITISFDKDKDYYDAQYTLKLEEGIKGMNQIKAEAREFKFYVPDYIGIYSAQLFDEFGRELSHLCDAEGKETKLKLECNDVFEQGYFAVAAVKDENNRLAYVKIAPPDGDINLRLPENTEPGWYMELYMLENEDTLKPYREKKVCFKDKIIMVDGKTQDGNGSFEKPYKTIEEALGTLKNIENYTGIVIMLAEGEYKLDDTLVIDENFNFELPVEITAYNGGKVSVDNRIKLGKGSTVAEDMRGRFGTDVVCYNLEDYGMETIDELKPYGQNYSVSYHDIGVYSGTDAMTLARYPNEGYLNIKNVSDNGNFSSISEDDVNNRGGTFLYSGADTGKWQDKSDIWMFGYPRYTWQHLFIKLQSISDTSITTHHASSSGFFYGQGFYLANIPEELDSANEYYLDRDNKILYVSSEAEDISICFFNKPLLQIKNINNLTFRDINFYGTRVGAIDISNCNNIDFDSCDVACVGMYGVNMTNVTECDFINGEMYNLGGKGIVITSGDKSTMENCKNKIINNKIHDFGLIEKTYSPAVSINSIGDYIAYNEIYNTDHMAISFYGNNNIYEYNDVHDVLRYADDSGAAYSGRSWISGGNIFRYNYFHDLGHSVNGLYNNAIYLDDAMFNAIIYGNIFENLQTGVFVHGGRCNEIYSNIFIDTENPVEVVHVYSDESIPSIVANAYVALLNKAFADCFPNLTEVIDDERTEPKYNKAYNNALINSGEIIFDESAAPSAEIYKNEVADRTIFNGEDYTITSDSPVHTLIPGFLTIDFGKIGVKRY